MNWEAIGAIGEILGALGVIVTLAYLAMQIKHNSKVAQSATRQAISDSTVGLISDLTTNDAMANILVRSFEGDTLTKVESFMLHARCYRDMKHFENVFYQLREGLLREDEWSGFRENLKIMLVAIAYRDYWSIEASLFSRAYQAEISNILREIEEDPPGDNIVSRMQSTRKEE